MGLIYGALDSGRLTRGRMHAEFESQFSSKHGTKYAVFVNSGTSALQLSIQALSIIYKWPKDAEVIVPATTFIATANAVINNGFKPKFVDVHPLTFNMYGLKVTEALNKNTRAIIPVHLCGLPVDVKEIEDVLANYDINNVHIIEDACESLLVKHGKRQVGALGDIGCFSTYMAHILTTGVGGMVTTNQAHIYEMVRSLMNHGRDPSYRDIDNPGPIRNRFKFMHNGHSFRSTEMEAAIGLAQIQGISKAIKKRQENAEYLSKALHGMHGIGFQYVPHGRESAYMMFAIVVLDGSRDKLVEHLEGCGIETRDLPTLINQPALKKYPELVSRGKFPVSYTLATKSFYVGCHESLSKEDLDYLAYSIRRFYEK